MFNLASKFILNLIWFSTFYDHVFYYSDWIPDHPDLQPLVKLNRICECCYQDIKDPVWIPVSQPPPSPVSSVHSESGSLTSTAPYSDSEATISGWSAGLSSPEVSDFEDSTTQEKSQENEEVKEISADITLTKARKAQILAAFDETFSLPESVLGICLLPMLTTFQCFI